MLNNLFKKYSDQSFKEIDIDRRHKKELQNILFKEKEAKPHFWTWTKAIFTAPVVAAFAIIFILSSNQETVKQVLLPQEALAQALENTFNLDNFEKTFGLPDDGKFYHRIMTYYANDPQNPNGSTTHTTDLWTDGTKVRRDTLVSADDSRFHNFLSFLIDPVLNKNCSFSLFKECEAHSKFDQDFINLFKQGKTTYKPVEEENLISDLSVEPFYDGPKGPIYLVQWSTQDPMENAEILDGYSTNGGVGGMIDDPYTVSHPDANHYVNVLKDAKYWHKTEVAMDMNFISSKKYFQITNHALNSFNGLEADKLVLDHAQEENSMIYTINMNDKLGTVTPKQFIEEIKKENASTNASKDMFYMAFQSAIILLKRDDFSEPVFSKSVEKNGQNLIQIRYIMPETYNRMMMGGDNAGQYVVDLFIDEAQTHFIGYELMKDQKELESIWIKDEILQDPEKSKIFDQANWEASIDEEYKLKEAERQQALEDIKYQEETGQVRIHFEGESN